jgi:uncharacterized membrane protein
MHYAIPMLIVALPLVLFFAFAGRGFAAFGRLQTVLRSLAALPLLVSATGHFARTSLFAGIIPPEFPHPVFLVILSGALEVLGAIGLLLWPTRRAASLSLALLMIAVFPANIYAANQVVGGLHMPGIPVRTAMQVVYILLLLVGGWGLPRRRASPRAADVEE